MAASTTIGSVAGPDDPPAKENRTTVFFLPRIVTPVVAATPEVDLGALCGLIAGRARPCPGGGVAGRALSPFSGPFHHFPWDIPGQMP
jgi:hypothetical protein